jgi:hypothetical protein
MLLGLLACLSEDPAERAGIHAEASVVLAQGCAAHSHLAYYRLVIEDAIARREWPQANEHIAALAAFTRPEPLPYTDFIMARGRTLVALAAQPRDERLKAELADLRAEAERLRWPIGWPEWADAGTLPGA